MNFKSFCTGVQHIGIPTDNIEKTVSFYEEMRFDKVYEIYNENTNQNIKDLLEEKRKINERKNNRKFWSQSNFM